MADISSLLKFKKEDKENISGYIDIAKSVLFFYFKLIFIPILLAGFLGYYLYNKKSDESTVYNSNLSFVETTKLSSGASNLAQQYGLGGLTSSSTGQDIVTGILKSDAVIGKALFSPISVSNPELLINQFLEVYFPDSYPDSKFYDSRIDSLSVEKKSLYKNIFGRIVSDKTNLMTFTSGDVHSLSVSTINEDLSYNLSKGIFSALLDFYRENDEAGFETSIKTLKIKRDSTYKALGEYEEELANNIKQSSGFYRDRINELPDFDLQREIALTQTQYATLVSTIERIKIQESQIGNPFFRPLNIPIYPLSKTTPQPFMQGVIGAAAGFFLGLFLITLIYLSIQGRKLYKSIRS